MRMAVLEAKGGPVPGRCKGGAGVTVQVATALDMASLSADGRTLSF